ncbi:hypothetical protein HDU76_013334 [Blyttiomyces sp. JEL0837]|nr:hypothetical protein HDU76_013334 [Blyttiomyces sp. JEL0837]
MVSFTLWVLIIMVSSVISVSAGDPSDTTTMTGSNARNGYLKNTGIDKSSLSSSFSLLFDTDLNQAIPNAGQIYATPLAYTPPSHSQVVFVVTMENKIFTLDAANGTVLRSRALSNPFPYSVTYANTTAAGGKKTYQKGQANYEFHAVDVLTLEEKQGFPVLLDGVVSDNGLVKFMAQWQMNRPGLLLLDGVVYGAFASHCDKGTYTGWIIGINAATGAITSKYVTNYQSQSTPNVPVRAGGGIWSSGSGLAADDQQRIYFSTGNSFINGFSNPTGPESVLNGPVGGNAVAAVKLGSSAAIGVTAARTSSTTTAKSLTARRVMRATASSSFQSLKPSGNSNLTTLHNVDFFTPSDRWALDVSDADVGSGGVVLSQFGNKSVAVVIRKDGQMYVLDPDDLGGFQKGAGNTDKGLFSKNLGQWVWGRVAVCPLDGGYMYATPVDVPMTVLQYSPKSVGDVFFTQVTASTGVVNSFGVGSPAVTSSGDASGSCVVWYVHTDGATPSTLYAFDGVPSGKTVNLLFKHPLGVMVNKFVTPGFGKQRVFVPTSNGHIFGFGPSSQI